MKNFKNISEDGLSVMHLIHMNPKISQRQLAKNTGLSIGKVNYCLKSLVDIGYVKILNFQKSDNKLKYAYILTPSGLKQKTIITKKFIIKKQQEFDKLQSYLR